MRFDADVRYLNSRALGADLFCGIESSGDGVVLVSTTAPRHTTSIDRGPVWYIDVC